MFTSFWDVARIIAMFAIGLVVAVVLFEGFVWIIGALFSKGITGVEVAVIVVGMGIVLWLISRDERRRGQ